MQTAATGGGNTNGNTGEQNITEGPAKPGKITRPVSGNTVAAPVIEECPITLECKLEQTVPLGSHILFIGKITSIQLDSDLIDAKGRMDINKADLISYAHGHYYSLGKCLGHFGYSVRKKKGPVVRK